MASGRTTELESFRWLLGPAGDARICCELLDQLKPKIEELTQAMEAEVEKRPVARRLKTHPGVGPLTALAFVLIIGDSGAFPVREASRQLSGTGPAEESSGDRRRLGHITKQGNALLRFLWWKRPRSRCAVYPEWRSKFFHLAMRRGRKIAKVAMARSWRFVCTGCGGRDGITSSGKVRFAGSKTLLSYGVDQGFDSIA